MVSLERPDWLRHISFLRRGSLKFCVLLRVCSTGPSLEASDLLQILGCLVRRPLHLAEFTRQGLCSLPMELLPTFLINGEKISSATLELLRASSHRNAFIPWRAGLINIFCPKAMYCGETVEDTILDDTALHINLTTSSGQLPILDEQFCDKAAREFQSKFLN